METIYITSGEGERGMCEEYTGERTRRALKARLTRERCHGDRWAKAHFESGETIDPNMLPERW